MEEQHYCTTKEALAKGEWYVDHVAQRKFDDPHQDVPSSVPMVHNAVPWIQCARRASE